VSSPKVERALTRPRLFDTEIGGLRVRVVPLGLACCAVELSAGMANLAPACALAPDGAVEPDCHVLVVAGTVTHAIADDVRAAWDSLPEPRVAVAFGACTISGGPYWDSIGSARPATLPIAVVRLSPGPDTLAAAVAQAVAAGAAGVAAPTPVASPAEPNSRSGGPSSRSEDSEDG
jgi:NADH-quinone oxidoreductase subunit B